MAKPLSKNDLDFIIFSLRETKKRFESFDDAPDGDHRNQRVREVEKIIEKVEALRQELS